uniref:EF hand domain-containing protein, putative n=1 Tax=Neospora caninum (strain Liverpool) TaxID=572307 RepID=A0A0F7URP8_NEOCL|nr:TPA: EF hand domain-containing protein, putative [Neospora caninum Liverpool]
MGNTGSSQAPVWAAPSSITASTSPLGVLRRLTTSSAVNCIGRYRSQSQTLHIFDSGSLEDLCDDLASECKQFADPAFRHHLIALFTGTNDRRSHALPHEASAVSRGSAASAAGASTVTAPFQDANDAADGNQEGEELPRIQVDSLAVFASLLFLSDGALVEKMEHCIRLLCWTQEPQVDPASVFLLLAALARGVALLKEDAPPSVLLIGEVLSRLEKRATVITASAKFSIETNGTDQQSGDAQTSSQPFLIRPAATVASAGPHSPVFFAGLPSVVVEGLHKLDGVVWAAESVWESLADDAAVRAYHDRVTQVFFSEQIDERLVTLSTNFKRLLQRVCNPEAYRAEQRSGGAATQQARHGGTRSSRMSKSSAAAGWGTAHDLTPLSWRQVNVLLRCCGSKAVTALLLDEMQFEASMACHEVGICWKKWADEPLREAFDEDEVSAEVLGTPAESSSPPLSSTGTKTASGSAGGSAAPAGSLASPSTGNARKPASAPASTEAPSDTDGATHPAVASSGGKLTSPDTAAGSAGSPPSGNGDGGETVEGTGGGDRVTFAKPAWKFVASSGPFVWSDDLQMFFTPLLAFSAIDCHGEGVISSRHLDLLLSFLKQLDPVHGGFYSRLEKVLSADTRALFSIPSDVPDPFTQLRAELSPEKQQIRLLRFGITMAVCAAIQDRRQHETSLNNRFRRFDVDKSGFILTADMQLLLTEMIRKATEIDDASTAVEQALQNVVDKYMNLFVGPSKKWTSAGRPPNPGSCFPVH